MRSVTVPGPTPSRLQWRGPFTVLDPTGHNSGGVSVVGSPPSSSPLVTNLRCGILPPEMVRVAGVGIESNSSEIQLFVYDGH